MPQDIHIYSEIGKLNKVLLHRLGNEIEGLVPQNFERLLFDDIPYLKVAQQEHDKFAEVLRENDIEVAYYTDETAKALSQDWVRKEFILRFISESDVYSEEARFQITDYLMNMPVNELLDKVVNGIKKTDIDLREAKSLVNYINNNYPYYTDPMPNLYFTRDQGAFVGNGLTVHHMSTKARRREALLLEYMYRFDRDLAQPDTPLWYDYDDPYSLEGGDILVLSNKIVAVGLSQRTTAAGIETFASKLLGHSSFEKILVFEIPKKRAFMHLDTVFTMVDYDKFTIHPEIEGPLQIYEITLDSEGSGHFVNMQDSLEKILASELGLPAVELIRCGGDDDMAAQREQWNDGSNTLTIAPGKVITYERNYITNELLAKKALRSSPYLHLNFQEAEAVQDA